VGLFFFISIPTWTCGGLTREIDKFLDTRVIVKTSLNQILCPQGIDFEISFFLHCLGDACKMKYLIGPFYGFFQRVFITTISIGPLDRKAFEPL
jgi:hypothetical protein